MNNDIPSSNHGGFKLEQRGEREVYHASFWHNGKHRRKSLKTTNLKEAKRRLRKLVVRIDSGEFDDVNKKLSVKELADLYLDHLRTEKRSQKTMLKYTMVLKDFADYLDAQSISIVRQVLPTHFDRYRAARREKWSSYTLYNLCVVIKQLFKWATKRELIRKNPLENYDLNKQRRVKHACPTEAEVKRILELVPVEYKLPMLVLACSGMRSGELVHLQVTDVDLQGKWFEIVSREGAATKTGESRKVPIHMSLLPFLKAHRIRGNYFFSSPASEGDCTQQLFQKRLNAVFTQAVTQAGMKAGRKSVGFVIHSLRHFFKSKVLNGGTPQPVADSWVGHREKGMNSVYWHLTLEESQKLMQRLTFDLL